MNPEILPESRDMALELQFHQEIKSWLNERAASSEHIDILEYDPAAYPEQRIDVALSPHSQALLEQENKESMQSLLGLLSMSFKSEQKAIELVGQFKEQEADGVAKIEKVRNYLDEGQNVGIITPHFVYDDIAKALGAATIALDDKNQIPNNLLVINKAFSMLKFYEMPISVPTRFLGNVAWLMPEVGAKKHSISDEVFSGINRRGIRAYNTQLRKGGQLVGYAPTGTGIKRDEHDRYVFSPLPDSSVGIMAKLDAVLPVTIWQDEGSGEYSTKVGNLIDLNHDAEKRDKVLLGKRLGGILCNQLADVSGNPVMVGPRNSK